VFSIVVGMWLLFNSLYMWEEFQGILSLELHSDVHMELRTIDFVLRHHVK
jgi:hypothetical protein